MATIPTIQINREEECLRAIILKNSDFMPTPITREEEYYKAIANGVTTNLITPITREEEYLYAIALKSVDVKLPINREEEYLYNWAKGTHITPVPVTRKEEYLDYICNANLSTTLKIDMFATDKLSPQTVGNTIILATISSGGTGTLQTRYTIFDGSKWTIIKAYSTVTNTSWTPTKAGTYQVWTDVKDSTGNVVSKPLYYTIK